MTGATATPHAPAGPPASHQTTTVVVNNKRWGCLSWIGLAVVVFLFFMVCGSMIANAEPEKPTERVAATSQKSDRVGSCLIVSNMGFAIPNKILLEFCRKNEVALRVLTLNNWPDSRLGTSTYDITINLNPLGALLWSRNTEEIRYALKGIMMYVALDNPTAPGYSVEIWSGYDGPVALGSMGPASAMFLPRIYEFPDESPSNKKTVIR